jgi:hypothetical protein
MGWSSTGHHCRRCQECTTACTKCTGDGSITGFIGTRIDFSDGEGKGFQCPTHGGDWE